MEKEIGIKKIRIFEIHSDDPGEMRHQLIMEFPSFLASCKASSQPWHLKYDELGAARFDRDYGMEIQDFIVAAFIKPSSEKKYPRRKLGVTIK